MTLTDLGLTLLLICAVIGLAVTAVSLDARRRVGAWPFKAPPRRHCLVCGRGPFAVTKAGAWRKKHRCVEPVPPGVAQ